MWHPRCGPCPNSEVGGILNGSALLGAPPPNGNVTDTDIDRLSNSAMSEMQVCYNSYFKSVFGVILQAKTLCVDLL